MVKSGERTFILECLVHLAHVTQRRFSFERKTPVLDVLEYVRLDSVVQSGDLEDGNEVVDEFSGGYFSQEVVTPVLDTYVCELRVQVRDARHGNGEGLTPRARIWTFGFLWLRRRLRARMVSFAGADFERIWSHISRLSATSSEPAGMSSEVALSGVRECQRVRDVGPCSPTASSICEVPQSQLVSDVILSIAAWHSRSCAVSTYLRYSSAD